MSNPTTSVIKYLSTLLNGLLINPDSTRPPYFIVIPVLTLASSITNVISIVFYDTKDILLIANELTVAVAVLMAFSKILTLAVSRYSLKNILNDISSNLTETCDDYQRKILSKASKISHNILRCLTVGTLSFQTLYAGRASLDGKLPLEDLGHVFPGDGVTSFVLNYIDHIAAMFFCLCAILASDGILMLSLMQLEAGLDVLSDKINNVKADNADDGLRDVWKYHMLVMRIKQDVNRSFSAQMSTQYIMSVGLLCFSVYGFTEQGSSVLIIMASLASSEIFSLCYFGQQVQTKSESILEQLYFTPWLEFRLKDRRRLIIIMLASMRTLTIETSFTTLQRATLVQVVKTTYSLYTLLHK